MLALLVQRHTGVLSGVIIVGTDNIPPEQPDQRIVYVDETQYADTMVNTPTGPMSVAEALYPRGRRHREGAFRVEADDTLVHDPKWREGP